jgi:hypothetical protein
MKLFETALQELLETAPMNPNPKGIHPPLNHGPMAIEALEALGYESEIPTWMNDYRSQLGPKPPRIEPIGSDWEAELGKFDRFADWDDYFRSEIQRFPWAQLLRLWLPRLLPGMLADGSHGLIRVAHATRSLERNETELRKLELAQALAMWAADYLPLVNLESFSGTNDLITAFKSLPIFEQNVDRTGIPPFVVKGLLDGEKKFERAVMSLEIKDDISPAISSLSELGANIYLANADYFPLIQLHSITGPASLRLILPYLNSDNQKRAYFYVWQVVAAAFSAYGVTKENRSVPYGEQSSRHWVERAIATLDEHAIKLLEACIREEKQNPTSIYAMAIADWVRRVEKSIQWNDQERFDAGLTSFMRKVREK